MYILGVSYKKTLNHPKVDHERRSAFCQKIKQLEESGTPIVYIDESGFAYDMPRTHGYSIKGRRCYGKRDWGKCRVNAIGALTESAIITVGLLTGLVDTEVFISNWYLVLDLI